MKKRILNLLGMATVVAIAALTIVPVNQSAAAEYKVGMIMVKEPWARGTPKSGGAFFMIHNMGGQDRLVGVKGEVANKVQLHQSVMEGGMMKMKHVDGIDIPAKGMATLAPGGFHVMMMGLKKPLMVGHSFPLTLVFEKAGELKINVEVRKLGAKGASGMSHGHDMKKKTE